MKKIERKEHGKILLGYVLLLALVVASFYGVWRQLEVLERPAAEETLIARRRSATFDFVLGRRKEPVRAHLDTDDRAQRHGQLLRRPD